MESESSRQLLLFQRPDRMISVGFSLARSPLQINPPLHAPASISPLEWDRASQFQHPHAKNAFILGRLCAKEALHLLLPKLDLASVSILSSFAGNPILQGHSDPHEISISHSQTFAIATAAPAIHPVTIDLEKIRHERIEAIHRMLTTAELELVETSSDPASSSTLLWTAKEALSKWLHSGMSLHFKVLEIKSLTEKENHISGEFAHIFHLRFESWRINNWWLTLVFPNKSQFLGFNPPTLEKLLEKP